MQSTDKFVAFAAAKAMYSVLISNKELVSFSYLIAQSLSSLHVILFIILP